MKVEQELDIRIKDRRKEEVIEMHFFCLGITQNFISFVFMRDGQSYRKTCVEESGHEW